MDYTSGQKLRPSTAPPCCTCLTKCSGWTTSGCFFSASEMECQSSTWPAVWDVHVSICLLPLTAAVEMKAWVAVNNSWGGSRSLDAEGREVGIMPALYLWKSATILSQAGNSHVHYAEQMTRFPCLAPKYSVFHLSQRWEVERVEAAQWTPLVLRDSSLLTSMHLRHC